MPSRNHWRYKKLVTVLNFLVMVTMSGVLNILPTPVDAQGVVSAPDVVSTDITLNTKNAVERKVDKVEGTLMSRLWKIAVMNGALALKNVSIRIVQSLSDSAVSYLETGSPGKEPVWYTSSWKSWGNAVVGATMSELLTELSAGGPWADYFDICEPSVDVKLRLIKFVEDSNVNRNPFEKVHKNRACDWDNVKDRWVDFGKSMEDKYIKNPEVASFLTIDTLVAGTNPNQNEVGKFLKSYRLFKTEEKKRVEAEVKQREANGEYKADGGSVTGTTQQNPPGTSKAIAQAEMERKQSAPQKEVESASQVVDSIPEAVVNTFMNSFVSQRMAEALFKRIKKGFANTADTYNPVSQTFDFRGNAERSIAKLNEVSFTFNQKSWDFLSNFTTCSTTDPVSNLNTDNCVMTQKFADIVRDGQYGKPKTVKEAVESGDLDNWPFIGDVNTGSDCVNKGYCYSNLVKLRKARLIPIGWELAAKQAYNNNPNGNADINLKFLYECFSSTTTDPNDACFPYKGLVDPNWVLKYPATICEAVAYGPILGAKGGAERYQYCADAKSCVAENDDGSCAYYSYCAAEKNSWKIGSKACPGYFDSCTTLTNRTGKTVNYLANTLDAEGCNSSNVGCFNYSIWGNPTENTVASWSQQYPEYYHTSGNSYVYLNKDIEGKTCSPDKEGCSTVISTDMTGSANLVPNSDMDYFTGTKDDTTADVFSNWSVDAGTTTFATTGSNGVSLEINRSAGSGKVFMAKPVAIAPQNFSRLFVFSAQVNVPGGGLFSMAPETRGFAGSFVPVTKRATDVNVNPLADSVQISKVDTYSTDNWSEVYYIVKVSPGTAYLNVAFTGTDGVKIDQVMIVETDAINRAPNYGSYGTRATDYLKVAPDYYACYDAMNTYSEAANDAVVENGTKWYSPVKVKDITDRNLDARFADAEQCDKFAKMCAAEEVGCHQYDPTDGGIGYSAVAAADDACPAACAGYETYSQATTNFVNSQFPLYLIPTTGKTCSASQVGCEEFTNLDTLQAGGESRVYYSDLQLCKKVADPAADPTCGSYYTWMGTDVSGYQLQVFNLEKDGNAPKQYSLKPLAECNATSYNPKTFPECRQFYNASGNVFYATLANAKKCTDTCQPLRRTQTYADASNTSSTSNCQKRGGQSQGNDCVFYAVPNESVSCGEVNAGCRAYKGNTANDVAVLFEDQVDRIGGGATLPNWTGTYTISQESMINGGTSVKVDSGKEVTVSVPLISKGSQYIVSFWGEADSTTANAKVTVTLGTSSNSYIIDGIAPRTTGSGVHFVHYNSDVITADGDYSSLKLAVSQKNVYFDSLELKKMVDTRYLIVDSWNTPDECNKTNAGQRLDQAQLGCREYKNEKKETKYFRSFRNTCRSEAVGCESFIATNNTTSPFNDSINAQIVDPCAVAVQNGDAGSIATCTAGLYSALNVASNATLKAEYDACDSAVKLVKLNESNGEITAANVTDVGAFVSGVNAGNVGGDPALASGVQSNSGSAAQLQNFLGSHTPTTPPVNACKDGIDNDGDGKIDLNDPGCKDANWDTENPQCSDGIDNDGDGKIDNQDPQCITGTAPSQTYNAWQNTETGLIIFFNTGYRFGLVQNIINLLSAVDPFYFDNTEVASCKRTVVSKAYCESQQYSWQNGQCVVNNDAFVTPADHLIYLVKTKAATCNSASVGCTQVGKPKLGSDLNVKIDDKGKAQWENKFYLLDGDNMGQYLCSSSESRCEEYKDSTGKTTYFRDPGERVCEYAKKKNVNGVVEEGWYIAGSTEPCSVNGHSVTRDYYGDGVEHLMQATDPGYNTNIQGLSLGNGFYLGKGESGYQPIDLNWVAYFNQGTKDARLTFKAKAITKTGALKIHLMDVSGHDAITTVNVVKNDNLIEHNNVVLNKTGLDMAHLNTVKFEAPADTDMTISDIVLRNADSTIKQKYSTQIGWAGSCTNKYDQCTAFLDPADVAGGNAAGKAYYSIKDDDIRYCSTVSQKEGCLLMNDTRMGETTYNAQKSYAASEAANGIGVTPRTGLNQAGIQGKLKDILDGSVSCYDHQDYCSDIIKAFNDPTNNTEMKKIAAASGILMSAKDARYEPVAAGECKAVDTACYIVLNSSIYNNANTIIQVDRDRACAQWYDCQSGQYVYNKTRGAEEFVCDKLGLCDAYGGAQSGGVATCAHFVPEDNSAGAPLLAKNRILNTATYQSRDLKWNSLDYSGYALTDRFPLQFYQPYDVNLGKAGQSEAFRMVHVKDVMSGVTKCDDKNTAASCGSVNDICIGEKKCAESIHQGGQLASSSSVECRAYPRADTPFPAVVKAATNPEVNNYENVLTCTGADANYDCGCAYKKYTYGSKQMDKYLPVGTVAPEGFCQDFPEVSCLCESVKDTDGNLMKSGKGYCYSNICSSTSGPKTSIPATVPGMCLLRDDLITEYRGWEGYCMETDPSYPSLYNIANRRVCNTWYPLDSMAGLSNLYNNYKEAGYNPPDNSGRLYCVDARGNHIANNYQFVAMKDHELIEANPYDYVEDYIDLSTTNLNQTVLAGVKVEIHTNAGEDFNETINIKKGYFELAKPMTITDGSMKDYDFYKLVGSNAVVDDQSPMKDWTYWQTVIGLDGNNQNVEKSFFGSFMGPTDSFLINENESPLFVKNGDFNGCLDIFTGVRFDCNTFGSAEQTDDYILGGSTSKNYVGVRILFDKDGWLQGAWAAMGDDDGGNGSLKFTLTFTLNEYCTKMAQVVDPSSGANKAFTNEIYSHTYKDAALNTSAGTYKISWGTDRNNPLISAEGSTISSLNKLFVVRFTNDADKSKDPGGSPYVTDWLMKGSEATNYKDGGKPWGCFIFPPIYGFTSLCPGTVVEINTNTTPYSYTKLTDVFAKVYKGWEYAYQKNPNKTKYEEKSGFITDTSKENVKHPPLVAAAYIQSGETRTNPTTNKPLYSAKLNTIAVDNRVIGDYRIPAKSHLSTFTFFAWANDDQMPLMNVAVDGDGRGAGAAASSVGKYKNYKPVCQATEHEELNVCIVNDKFVPGLSCRVDSDCPASSGTMTSKCGPIIPSAAYLANLDRFGDIKDACFEQQFIRSEFPYNCEGYKSVCTSDVDLADAKAYLDGTSTKKPACFCEAPGNPGNYATYDSNCWNEAEQACQWVPRVQVKDNWGWCNADASLIGTNSACQFGTADVDWAGAGCYTSDDKLINGCNGDINPSAWTYFNGRILLKP